MYEHPSHPVPDLGFATAADIAPAGISLSALAGIVHDLRTPVLAMLGFGHILRDSDDPQERDRAAQRLEMAGTHLLAVVGDILELSRIDAGRLDLNRTQVDSMRLFGDCIAMMGDMAAAKGLQLCLEISPHFPNTFLGDARRLRQILINLLSNAVKLTEQGSVRLVAEVDLRGGALRISVVDTGPGLSPEQADRLFNPFQQAEPLRDGRLGGTGLGLAISRALAEAMGGTLCLKSSKGAGATFTLALPMIARGGLSDAFRPDCAAPVTASPKGPQLPEGTRVLVADDDLMMRDLASAILRCLGAELTVAGSGDEALRRAASEPFDIILLDRHLGDMDGITVASQLRAQGGPSCGAMIIGMTASTSREDRTAALAAGMDAYVDKALTPNEIASLVSELNQLRGLAPQPASSSASR